MADQDNGAVVPETPLWTPSAQSVRQAAITGYMDWAAQRQGRPFDDYDQLWQWSVTDLEGFWASVWEYGGVRASAPYQRVLADARMPGAQWFTGAQLNFAENVLARSMGHAGGGGGGALAVLHQSELRGPDTLTRAQLRAWVATVAGGLRELGVESGDRVVAYMPNIVETLVAFLAVASVGAVWSSAAPELGGRSVIDRFSQIAPRVLLAVDGYRYGGRDFDRRGVLNELVGALPSLQHVVLLGYLDTTASPSTSQMATPAGAPTPTRTGTRAGAGTPAGAGTRAGAATGVRPGSPAGSARVGGSPGAGAQWIGWDQLERLGDGAPERFEQVPFDHPLWVLYSSGTTGLPKPIVHGHGGILVEQLKKGLLHLDLRAGDRMFWYTTTAWMMWNFLVGCLLTDAAVVLYDGSPVHPHPDAIWELAETAAITCLGTSAGFISSAMKRGSAAVGEGPGARFDLGALRAIGSTGSPLSPEGFQWIYEAVDPDVWLYSTSGGTDVCTAFLGGCPILPVYAGELQCRALGCAVEAFDEAGNSVVDEVGELVITQPMPSMPLYLWGDDDGARYHDSYFSTYDGIWRHGDWVRITTRGGGVIYGRSDATINRGGVRMGTSEIYRAVAAVAEVSDAMVVELARGESSEIVLFVVLATATALDDDLRGAIRARIAEDCSPRHVPDAVVAVPDVPRTLSGKLLEVPVKRILAGARPEEAASLQSLANPQALDCFIELARTRAAGQPW